MKKNGRKEIIYPLTCIRNLLGEERNTPVKTTVSSDGTYIQYDIKKAFYWYNWRIKKHKIFMEN